MLSQVPPLPLIFVFLHSKPILFPAATSKEQTLEPGLAESSGFFFLSQGNNSKHRSQNQEILVTIDPRIRQTNKH